MSPSHSAASQPTPISTPAAEPGASRVEVTDRARQRVAHLLASGSAGLRSFDRRLAALAARDWSVSALAKELEGAAHEATTQLEKRARKRLRQLDHLPVDAAAATLGRSRSAVHAITTALQRAAKKVGGHEGATAP
ncbi:hypothetical protein [Anaeromyxobacter diazotrophicus]|uniref:Uncharacterized protein n=1 Tax=Anaeromyxobacter diazotrophicus TaxID=2590199 RepID=A0A7I9VJB3_9BACT|nr:hypothetical protein [Anaeromyxobacter diazotrophicus]GEJ56455.1 hypothetical protein AMYX_11960 [Anaeromyxobacter diazotrophicus]